MLRLAALIPLVFFCTSIQAAKPIDWNDKELNWHSYEEGMALIEESGQRGLFIIYADWCPTCMKYSKLFKTAEVVKALDGLVLIRSNKDEEPDISKRYGLDGEYIPRTFALEVDGEIIEDLNAKNPRYWYFLPPNDASAIAGFAALIKDY